MTAGSGALRSVAADGASGAAAAAKWQWSNAVAVCILLRMARTEFDPLLWMLRRAVVGIVAGHNDLTARQLAIFLTCYLRDEGQTVRGLAKEFRAPKSAITRSLDVLEGRGLATRERETTDRRSIVIRRTLQGNAFFRTLIKNSEGD